VEESSPDPTTTDESVADGRDQDSSSNGFAPASDAQDPSARTAAPSHQGAGSPITNPDPQITIVSAPVTDTASGPGPTAAVIGAIAIALLAALAYLRRRTTRWGTSSDA
jgi:MYXO-CTERM domain-containing protein